MISAGRVQVDGAVATRASLEIAQQHLSVTDSARGPDLASRAGYKLDGALARWPDLRIAGRRCLDAGASTGGFTDVLLNRGARAVVAADVGRDQLVARLRDNPRVHVLDGCNVRILTADQIGGPVDVAVCDLAFISLTKVLDAIIGCLLPDGDLVPMVKPQFEVGRAALGRGGVVRNATQRADAVVEVAGYAARAGWGARAVTTSPLPGPAGNIEYFLWLRAGAATISASEIHARAFAAADVPAADVPAADVPAADVPAACG